MKRRRRRQADHPILVLVTAPARKAVARKLAHTLVSERLAACVNVLPEVRSTYRWKGKICEDPEFLLVIKTISKAFPFLKKRVLELHHYEVPEIIALRISDGERRYLSWLLGSVCIPKLPGA